MKYAEVDKDYMRLLKLLQLVVPVVSIEMEGSKLVVI